jgi:hypothetical protein
VAFVAVARSCRPGNLALRRELIREQVRIFQANNNSSGYDDHHR